MKTYGITTPKTVLLLGSGGQKIGQAGEYDYAGLQALQAYRAENIRIILINPNMASVQTSKGFADATYFLPVTAEVVAKIIEKEKPDSLVANFGGKTALDCANDLFTNGVLEKYNIQILGTPLASMTLASDRSAFLSHMTQAGIPVPSSEALPQGLSADEIAEKHGFPLMLRVGSKNGEASSEVCRNTAELSAILARSLLEQATIHIEQWLGGWKEIEFEVVRDMMDNCILACTMENIDPVGINPGESIVVTPAQTLSDEEMQVLRSMAFTAARSLNLIGDANIRFAIDPQSREYCLLEVLPRISRTTALASKATGIQLASVSARLSLGFSLSEIESKITPGLKLCTESALDYLVLKMPRWDFERFNTIDRHIGSGMKSVGEAIAFGKTFAEALQKAVRMTKPEISGLSCHPFVFKDIKDALKNPTDLRIFAVYSALKEGWTPERICKHSGISTAFIASLEEIAKVELELRELTATPDREILLKAKKAGFSDEQIAQCTGTRAEKIRLLRKEFSILPSIKLIDSVSAEFSSKSNLMYMTYHGFTDDVKPSGRGVLLPGSGPYQIGSSLEYDWSSTQALKTLRSLGHWSIMVNCNPESVSTETEFADRIYMEEISAERIIDIWEAEQCDGVLLSYGGQAAISLAAPLSRLQIPIYGTAPTEIARTNDRYKFSALLDQLNIHYPDWTEVRSLQAAVDFAEKIGYPLLVRPSESSGISSMTVAWDDASLKLFLCKTMLLSSEHPVILSRYIENSKEIEIEAVANKGEILVYAISEHIENAGVHSGDATVVLPAQRIYLSTAQAVKKAAKKIAKELQITGSFNIQFLAKSTYLQVIECTIRASRSLPFCSKVFKVDMVDMAVRAQLGAEVKKIEGSMLDFDYVGVRAAQFSYSRLKGADPVAGVQMSSTGEVGCLGRGVRDAFMKAALSTGFTVPKKKILLSTGPIEDKVDFIDSAKKLRAMGYELFASSGTARFLQNHDIQVTTLAWPLEEKKPNIADAIKEHSIDLVINIPKNNRETELKNDFIIRSLTVDYGIPLITNIKVAKQFTDALEWYKTRGLEVKSTEEYK